MYEVMVIENDVEQFNGSERPPLATWSEVFETSEDRAAYVIQCVKAVRDLGWPTLLSFLFNEDFNGTDPTAAPAQILETWS